MGVSRTQWKLCRLRIDDLCTNTHLGLIFRGASVWNVCVVRVYGCWKIFINHIYVQLQVPKLMMEINSRERRTRTRTMLTARTSRSQKFSFCTQEKKPGKNWVENPKGGGPSTFGDSNALNCVPVASRNFWLLLTPGQYAVNLPECASRFGIANQPSVASTVPVSFFPFALLHPLVLPGFSYPFSLWNGLHILCLIFCILFRKSGMGKTVNCTWAWLGSGIVTFALCRNWKCFSSTAQLFVIVTFFRLLQECGKLFVLSFLASKWEWVEMSALEVQTGVKQDCIQMKIFLLAWHSFELYFRA